MANKQNKTELHPENHKQTDSRYTRTDEILELIDDLGGTASPKMVYTHDHTDISRAICYNKIHRLDERGRLEKLETGIYRITEYGEERLTEVEKRDLEVAFATEGERAEIRDLRSKYN